MNQNTIHLLTNSAIAINGGSWHPATHTEQWNPLVHQHQADALMSALQLQKMELDGTITVLGRGYARSTTSKDEADIRRLVVEVAAAIGANIEQLRQNMTGRAMTKPSTR